MSDRPHVVRDPNALRWRAVVGDRTVGTAMLRLRPDDRTFVVLRSGQPGAYAPLLAAITDEVDGPLHTEVDADDVEALDHLGSYDFEVARRAGTYVIPVGDARARLRDADWPEGYSPVGVDDVDEDDLRELDDALRQDVPGTDGWRWDVRGFREETYESPAFDPELYRVARHDRTGTHVGLVRIWNNPDTPRLGLIAVDAAHRRRGLARSMLADVFAVLERRGASEVRTETDDGNHAARRLLLDLGARRTGSTVELVRAAGSPEWSIRREVSVDAPATVVWRCVGDPERVSRWWCPPPTVRIDFDAAEGARYRERYDDGEYRYELAGRILAYDPPRWLAVRRETPDSAAPADRIDITLTDDGERTRVVLEHAFEDLAPDRRDEMRDVFAAGWEWSLDQLATLATEPGVPP
jgi:uncharacterized protein YndB with AHSA1/START domain/ribosomal protein S18 acetylase RimI-like enzyme